MVSSDHVAETRASPLFRHSDVTAHLIIEQTAVMNDPGFQNAYFYLSKISVIEIGSDKMLIVMVVSIRRVA